MKVNFRSFLVIGVNIMITSAISVLIGYGQFWSIILLISQCFLILIFFIRTLKNKLRLHIPVTLGLTLIMCLITFFNVVINVMNWSHDYSTNDSYNVKGTVDSVSNSESGVIIVLQDLVIDGEKRSGNAIVEYAADYYMPINFETGYKIALTEKIYPVKILSDFGINANYYRQNVRYKINTSEENIVIKYAEKDFFQKGKSYIYSLLKKNLDSETASILYGMITGDKAFMEYGVASYYSAAGIGHIMAVSGLHVGFLCAVLIFLLSFITRNKKITRPIIISILFLYAALVGFTPSVMRAVIMSSLLLFIDIFGTSKDSLNNLFFAMTVILIFKPLLMFEVGFLLSCSTILAISLFYRPIRNFFKKFCIPSYICSLFSISLCAQLGIMPCMMFFFNSIQVYSLLINIILMPLISLVFYLAVIGIVLSAIFSPLGIVLKFSGLGLSAIDTISQSVSKWYGSEILVFSSFIVMLIYGVYFLISDKILIKKHKKRISVTLAFLCAFTFIFNIGFENKTDKNLIIPINSQGDVTTLLKLEDQNILIGDVNDFYSIKKTLLNHKIRNIDEVYTYSLTEENISNISKTCVTFNVKSLYVNSDLTESIDLSYLYLRNTKFYTYEHGAKFSNLTAYSSSEGKYFMYNDDNLNILFSSNKSKYSKLAPEIIDLVDIIRCYSFSGAYPKRFFIVNYVRSDIDVNPDFLINIKKYEFLAIDFLNGKIAY